MFCVLSIQLVHHLKAYTGEGGLGDMVMSQGVVPNERDCDFVHPRAGGHNICKVASILVAVQDTEDG